MTLRDEIIRTLGDPWPKRVLPPHERAHIARLADAILAVIAKHEARA